MSNPVFSVCFSAIRSNLYKSFYDSLSAVHGTCPPFEVIFVGDQPPTEPMPDNFKYIYSKVKPAQCTEIAVRHAVGDYILPFSDDETFSHNFLNRLHNYVIRLDTSKVFITFRYSYQGKINDEQLVFDPDILTSTVLGVAGCFRRDIWNELGGLDNRWIACYSDMDMQMRFFEYGMTPFIAPDCIIGELPQVNPKGNAKLYYRCGNSGRELWKKLWVDENGMPSKKRLLPVQPFNDNDILTKTQGEHVGRGKRGEFTYE